jgi:hypothetical protein
VSQEKIRDDQIFFLQKDEELFWMLGFALGFTLRFHKLRKLCLIEKLESREFFVR